MQVNIYFILFIMPLSVSILWDKELSSKLKKLSENDLLAAKNKMLISAANLIVWEAKRLVSYSSWSFKRSISYKLFKDYANVYSDVNYAVYVHEWVKPHIIRPIKKKSLYWENNWIWFFSKSVHHPWSKANPFFENAVKNCKNEIINKCNEILQCTIDKL